MRGTGRSWLWVAFLTTSIGCVMHSDSVPGTADPAVAAPATCTDQIKNGSETDIDCGGSGPCAACAVAKACAVPADCASQVCTGAICQAPGCADNVRNGSETDVDCGGSCGPCASGLQCRLGADCATGSCSAGRCVAYSCTDGIRNNDETDIDCGGANCNRCVVEQGCKVPSDCNTAVCGTNGTCRALPTCNDIHTTNPPTVSGAYVIDPGQRTMDETPILGYCDMTTDGGGWTLVYKASAGVAVSATGVWNTGSVRNENQGNFVNTGKNADHYLNRLATSKYWNANGVTFKEARVAVYTAGVEKAFVQFTNLAQDRANWYAKANIKKTTWIDLVGAAPNFFSITGDSGAQRGWFINNNYGGCPVDAGWLKVGEPPAGPCGWDNMYGAHTDIIYANFPVNQNWQGLGLVGVGDTFVVFVR